MSKYFLLKEEQGGLISDGKRKLDANASKNELNVATTAKSQTVKMGLTGKTSTPSTSLKKPNSKLGKADQKQNNTSDKSLPNAISITTTSALAGAKGKIPQSTASPSTVTKKLGIALALRTPTQNGDLSNEETNSESGTRNIIVADDPSLIAGESAMSSVPVEADEEVGKHMWHKYLSSPGGVKTIISLLDSLRAATSLALGVNANHWLAFNGTVHIYTICQDLMPELDSVAIEYLIWCCLAVDGSVMLVGQQFMEWRIILYTAVSRCFDRLEYWPGLDTFSGQAISKLEKIIHFISISADPTVPSILTV